MTKEQIKIVKELKASGLVENKDFRIVYFGIDAEIKIIKG